ncbi:hypothetical protein I302_101273 [Kwoniella bestiolae CBS 10118]|uniref:Uncharacterized protein n=1 Tax=Kwoniella bestiolae CBS 10118 TaxID=1296100 RepID=A0A1B9G7G2_9TREE|nr:hypothetical protein I302_04647 [Kwoniella bestiolae CBS 10118]OCF26956.1 hypothetical protein I302_04647 [Kwoniella bestiolae CBS 10118]
MSRSSGRPAGAGAWSGALPYHNWKESETCAVLDKIASSKSYMRLYILQPHQKYNDRDQKEKKLCLEILQDTEWMSWMIRHVWVIREMDGTLNAREVWHDNHMAITKLLKALHPLADTIETVLGPIPSEADIRVGSPSYKRWAKWQAEGKNTWYFKYVALQLHRDPSWLVKSGGGRSNHNTLNNAGRDRVSSFNDPAGINSEDEDYKPRSSDVFPRRGGNRYHQDKKYWPKRTVSERVPWSEYISRGERDTPPHFRQTTPPTRTTSRLVEMDIDTDIDTDPGSAEVEARGIEDHFDDKMFVRTPTPTPTSALDLNESMNMAPTLDIAKNIPLPASPILPESGVEGYEMQVWRDMVEGLLSVLMMEVEQRPSTCMANIEVRIGNRDHPLFPLISRLIDNLGGRLVERRYEESDNSDIKRYILHLPGISAHHEDDKRGAQAKGTFEDPVLDIQGLFALIRELGKKEVSPSNDLGDLLTF